MQISDLSERIYSAISKNHNESPRHYLGASSLGHAMTCERRAFLQFRHAITDHFDGRVLRIFETGHSQEDRIVRELRQAGYEVEGTQDSVTALGGHLCGHIDGRIRESGDTEWALLEVKTCNDRAFRQHAGTSRTEPKTVDVLKPVHYVQMQIYMGLSNLHAAVYLVINKNNEKIHVEHVDYDADYFDEIMATASRLLYGTCPDKPFRAPDSSVCMWCPASAACWDGAAMNAVCGTCTHYAVRENGRRGCLLHLMPCDQSHSCDDYAAAPWASIEEREEVSFWL